MQHESCTFFVNKAARDVATTNAFSKAGLSTIELPGAVFLPFRRCDILSSVLTASDGRSSSIVDITEERWSYTLTPALEEAVCKNAFASLNASMDIVI